MYDSSPTPAVGPSLLGLGICGIWLFCLWFTGLSCSVPGPSSGDASLTEHQSRREESADTRPLPYSQGCNGFQSLCAKRFNEVVYATSHNAMSSEDRGWTPPNHHFNMTKQLEAGIRAMMLDAHYENKVAHLCHGFCGLGKQRLDAGLKEIKDFLDRVPSAVFTIIFESYVSAADTKQAFEASGLLSLTYAHKQGQAWPTLAEMIKQNKRVVVMSSKQGGAYPWYHDMWKIAWDNDYRAKSSEDFKCGRYRGKKGNDLYIFNHFLTAPFAKPDLAKSVNFNPAFLERVKKCQRADKQLPNFITVDFYSIGDVLKVTDTLNQVTP